MIVCKRKDCVYNNGGACKAPNIRISVGGYCQRYFARSNSQTDPPAYLDNTYRNFPKTIEEAGE